MRPVKTLLIALAFIAFCNSSVNAQGMLKRLKEKAASVAEKAIDKKADEMINGKTGNAGEAIPASATPSAATGANRPSNKGGAGLITTPPDVNENLSSAESAFKFGKYGGARYAVQQAMLGVELRIGQDLLKSLPETVASLPKQADQDQVTSTGWGWAGLTIQRVYQKDDKQLTFDLLNNSMMMSAINMFLTNGGYAQTTGGQQNWKQTKLKGNRAVIEYDDNTGYKLSVPLGQSSLLVLEGVNFANEQDMMAAANQFDIDNIKKTLGEK